MNEKVQIITEVCKSLSDRDSKTASKILRKYAPLDPSYKLPKPEVEPGTLVPPQKNGNATPRKYSKTDATQVYIQDGFIDRYFNEKLVFTGVLLTISHECPQEFPFQSHWKIGECHQWYWELAPTLDHIDPVTNGGNGNLSNWITTSMANNMAKSNYSLESLGWNVFPKSDFAKWDGLIYWFIKYIENKPQLLKKASLKGWHLAAKTAIAEL